MQLSVRYEIQKKKKKTNVRSFNMLEKMLLSTAAYRISVLISGALGLQSKADQT